MLTGIRGLSDSFLRSLLGHAREWIAADVQIRLSDPATEEQQRIVDGLQSRGVTNTLVSGTIAMATAEFEPGLETVTVKVVDPLHYPFYGDIQTEPARPLPDLLKEDTLVCSPELLDRFHLRLGDSLVIGGATFRVAGILRSEPDRFAVTALPLKRVLISVVGLTRTRLLDFGNRGVYRLLLKLPPSLDPGDLRPMLQAAFPEGELMDYRKNDPDVGDIVEKTTAYLSLISLIGLLVGALGVAMALYSHLEQRLDMIAIMKILGGRANQIMLVFGIQIGIICLSGTLLGLALGVAAQVFLSHLLRRYLPFETAVAWDWRFALNGLVAATLCIGLASLPVLLRTRRVSPFLILRRNTGKAGLARGGKWSRGNALLALVLTIGFFLEGAWVSRSWKLGAYFVLAGVVSGVCCALAARILLAILRWTLGVISPLLSTIFRQGASNVYRPGNQAGAVLTALGAGVTCLFAGYLTEGSMTSKLLEWSPVRDANLFIANVGAAERARVESFVHSQPGVEQASELAPFVSMHLVSVDGVPYIRLPQDVREFLSTKSWYATSSSAQPLGVHEVAGTWWPAAENEPLLALSVATAGRLRVSPGSVLEFTAAGHTVRARIAVLHRATGIARFRYELTFSPHALDGLPLIFNAGLLVQPERMEDVKRSIGNAFPDLVLVDLNDVREILDDLVHQAVTVFRFLAFFAIAAGAAALGASVAGTRARRIKEVAILKVLGARPAQVIWIQAVEFSILGATAGVFGIVLGGALAAFLLRNVLEAEARGATLAAAASAIAGTICVANLAGWLASFRLLRHRPLQVLREE
jgi:putative ABC transport system permease protein